MGYVGLIVMFVIGMVWEYIVNRRSIRRTDDNNGPVRDCEQRAEANNQRIEDTVGQLRADNTAIREGIERAGTNSDRAEELIRRGKEILKQALDNDNN